MMLSIVLPTGRVFDEAVEVLGEIGLPTGKLSHKGRSLVIEDDGWRYFLAKPMDVPLFVHSGIADIGLAGSDVLWETNATLIELADTRRGLCRLVVAGPQAVAPRFMGHESALMWLKVATKYPRIADSHFSSKGVQVEVVHLHGSVELAPRLGLADCILDIVQTGATLEANHLTVLEEVAPVSLRMVASRYGIQRGWSSILPLVEKLLETTKERSPQSE